MNTKQLEWNTGAYDKDSPAKLLSPPLSIFILPCSHFQQKSVLLGKKMQIVTFKSPSTKPGKPLTSWTPVLHHVHASSWQFYAQTEPIVSCQNWRNVISAVHSEWHKRQSHPPAVPAREGSTEQVWDLTINHRIKSIDVAWLPMLFLSEGNKYPTEPEKWMWQFRRQTKNMLKV